MKTRLLVRPYYAQWRSAIALGLLVLVLATQKASGGEPFPLVQAVSSSNGKAVVLVEYRYDHPNADAHKITHLTYRVLQRQQIRSFPQLFSSPNVYWSEAWVLSKAQDGGPSLPVISDDARFLVLLSLDAPRSPSMQVLQVYRQRDRTHDAELVATCNLNDVWPSDKLPDNPLEWIITDHTPRWFEGGTFKFSSGEQELVHTTRWGKTVRIQLSNVAVITQCPVAR